MVKDESGTIIVDEKVKTQNNGFLDLWLPREKVLEITVSLDGKTATEEFTTNHGDQTCVTTMKIK